MSNNHEYVCSCQWCECELTSSCSLVRLAQKLASDGPFKIEHTPRRVRALFNGKYVIDTLQAHHVWEHPNFPQ